jgi:hypothetical protein
LKHDAWPTDSAKERTQHTTGGFGTKQQAQQFLTDTLAAIRGAFCEPSKVTLGEFLTERWLPVREMGLRPSTFASYRDSSSSTCFPRSATCNPTAAAGSAGSGLSRLMARDLAPKTVRNVHVLIHRAIRVVERSLRRAAGLPVVEPGPRHLQRPAHLTDGPVARRISLLLGDERVHGGHTFFGCDAEK